MPRLTSRHPKPKPPTKSRLRPSHILRTCCIPGTCVVLFSFLLTWVFILYQPTDGPGLVQRMGWQSWDTVLLGLEGVGKGGGGAQSDQSGSVVQGGDNGGGGGPTGGDGAEWWNVTQPASQIDTTSLPLDVWDPLLPHDTGLTEISIQRCMMNPTYASSLCAPSSTKEDTALKGQWVRIERDLNRQDGMWWLSVWYRRTRRQDVPLVDEMVLLREGEVPGDGDRGTVGGGQGGGSGGGNGGGEWKMVERSARDGVPGLEPLYLWYRLGKTTQQINAASSSQSQDSQTATDTDTTTTTKTRGPYIMEIDVSYGDGPAWYGYTNLDVPIRPEERKGGKSRVSSVWLSTRREVVIPPQAPPLHFTPTGSFKILQVADLHFSISPGPCISIPTSSSPSLTSNCTNSDTTTSTLLTQTIAHEKPNLIIYTGDQLNGQSTSWDPQSVLSKFALPAIDAGIPWAMVFGNHDDEDEGVGGEGGRRGKEGMVRMMQGLPLRVVERGPRDVHGVGNGVVRVWSADASKTQLLTLYLLDSGSYTKGVLDWFGLFRPTAYDYLRQSQIDWFLEESSKMPLVERPFRPDGGKDLGHIWDSRYTNSSESESESARQEPVGEESRLAKPNALMFFHIPLPEAYSTPDTNTLTNRPLDVGISALEKPGNAKTNEGFFEKGLLKALESPGSGSDGKGEGGKKRLEVKAVGNGHCHLTENCRRVKGVWMCFGGGGSYSGYGKIGFDRRFRIYSITDFGETIKTYKRTEHGEIVDEMVLSGKGAAP